MRQKRIQLGELVSSMRRIYLDQRFWLLMRDASLGRSHDKSIIDLYNFLKSSVSKRQSICPISESVFIELLKQSDETTKLATACLIDELSLGVTLISPIERIRQELCNFFYDKAGAKELIPTQNLVWTKLTYILGEVHPSNTQFPPELELVLQKAFSDYLCNISLVEIISNIHNWPPMYDWNALAARLNTQNHLHYSTLRSYAHTFRIEFEGTLDLFRSEMDTLSKEVYERGYKDLENGLAHLSQNKLYDLLALSLPTLHISTSCHAAVRWDQKRNLNGNDLFDFHHAQAALGYCDVFLTEKPLNDMLNQKHLGLTKYKCKTFWSPNTALDWLRENIG